MIVLTPVIENHNSHGYVAWTEEFKETVVEGATPDEAIQELIISLKVLFSYTFNWNINLITAKIVSEKMAKKSITEITKLELLEYAE